MLHLHEFSIDHLEEQLHFSQIIFFTKECQVFFLGNTLWSLRFDADFLSLDLSLGLRTNFLGLFYHISVNLFRPLELIIQLLLGLREFIMGSLQSVELFLQLVDLTLFFRLIFLQIFNLLVFLSYLNGKLLITLLSIIDILLQ